MMRAEDDTSGIKKTIYEVVRAIKELFSFIKIILQKHGWNWSRYSGISIYQPAEKRGSKAQNKQLNLELYYPDESCIT